MTTAFRLDLRRSRSLLLWIGLVSAFYAGFITAFYPTILENAEQFEQMLSIYPKELMAAFGISGSLGDPGIFFNSYVFQFLWPLVAAIAAILMATRVAADADRGFLELPLSTRLPRLRYLGATIGSQVVGMAILAAMTIAAILLVDLFIEPDFAVDRLALAGVHAFALGLAVCGVTALLAVLLLDRGRAGGLVAGILIVMYLVNVIAQLSPDLRALANLSAFHYFDLRAVIDSGTYPVADSMIYVAVAVIGWALALLVFRRRDLAA
jgi:ABC-2 type transport system permease protein